MPPRLYDKPKPKRRLLYLAEDVRAKINRGYAQMGSKADDVKVLPAGTVVLEMETFNGRHGTYTDFRCGRYWYRVTGKVETCAEPPRRT